MLAVQSVGKDIEKAADNVRDAAKDAQSNIENAAKDAQGNVENVADNVGNKVGLGQASRGHDPVVSVAATSASFLFQ